MSAPHTITIALSIVAAGYITAGYEPAGLVLWLAAIFITIIDARKDNTR